MPSVQCVLASEHSLLRSFASYAVWQYTATTHPTRTVFLSARAKRATGRTVGSKTTPLRAGSRPSLIGCLVACRALPSIAVTQAKAWREGSGGLVVQEGEGEEGERPVGFHHLLARLGRDERARGASVLSMAWPWPYTRQVTKAAPHAKGARQDRTPPRHRATPCTWPKHSSWACGQEGHEPTSIGLALAEREQVAGDTAGSGRCKAGYVTLRPRHAFLG